MDHPRPREGKAAIYAPRLWRIADFSLPEGISPFPPGGSIPRPVERVFHSIAVRSRENPRLQRQFMPKKFWKHCLKNSLPRNDTFPVRRTSRTKHPPGTSGETQQYGAESLRTSRPVTFESSAAANRTSTECSRRSSTSGTILSRCSIPSTVTRIAASSRTFCSILIPVDGTQMPVVYRTPLPLGRKTRNEARRLRFGDESEKRFHNQPVHPGRRPRVPCPSASPRMLRSGVHIGGDNIGFHFINCNLPGGSAVVHRIDHRKNVPCPPRIPQPSEGHCSPDGGMSILTSVLPHAGDIPLDIPGIQAPTYRREGLKS